jgi:hypothetical protein
VKLTFAEPVNDLNLSRMRQLVLNGAFKHPGACKVQKESGELIDLAMCSAGRLQQLSRSLVSSKGQAPMRVWRHLRDGDYVMVNRQPTLHRPSIMAHKVKVLKKQKTIRMHYANCNSYNADFDGDEINVHFPQDMVSQVEAKMVASTNHNYIVPTSSSPLRGLIQDHVAAGVYLTKVDTFFTRDRYQQLVYCCLGTMHLGRAVKILPPAIIKPTQLWSGKQLISTIIYNLLPPDRFEPLNIKSEAKVKGSYWGQHSEEGEVIIRGGELLVGILDKSQFGASQLGLVHCIFEAYGPVHAGEMLTVLGRLFTHFLQLRGFTCSIHDLVLSGARGVRVRVTRVCMCFVGRACVRVCVCASVSRRTARSDPVEGRCECRDRVCRVCGSLMDRRVRRQCAAARYSEEAADRQSQRRWARHDSDCVPFEDDVDGHGVVPAQRPNATVPSEQLCDDDRVGRQGLAGQLCADCVPARSAVARRAASRQHGERQDTAVVPAFRDECARQRVRLISPRSVALWRTLRRTLRRNAAHLCCIRVSGRVSGWSPSLRVVSFTGTGMWQTAS